jgi:hypothetical protein
MLFLHLLLQFNGKDGKECAWNVIKEIAIPPKANFIDYSGMAFRGEKVRDGCLAAVCGRVWASRWLLYGVMYCIVMWHTAFSLL